MSDPATPVEARGQFLVYTTEDGGVKIEVRLEEESVWLTQQHMAALFQTTQQNISFHLKNIFEEGELALEATHKKILSVRREGRREVTRALDFYYLDALNNLVEQYLLFAEGQAMRRVPMSMGDWIEKLNAFLRLNDRQVLEHAGKISHELAVSLSHGEYETFSQRRIAESDQAGGDFDAIIKQLPSPSAGKKGGRA